MFSSPKTVSLNSASKEQKEANSSHRRDIQGLRAIAVLAVIAFHSHLPIPGGFLGVDVFFTISGFVITAMLLREIDKTGTVSLRSFYIRRMRRLLPALAVVVVFAMTLGALLLSPMGAQQAAAATGVASIFGIANVVIAFVTGGYFAPDAEFNPLLNTWSLGVEEQFYVFLPALILVIFVSRQKGVRPQARKLLLLVLLLLSAASLIIALSHLRDLPNPWGPGVFGFYGIAGRIWEFGIGALLALAPQIRGPKWLSGLLFLGGLVLLAYSFFRIGPENLTPGLKTLIPVMGAAAMILAGSIGVNPLTFLISNPVSEYIGNRSYSLYLWHWPLLVFAAVIWPTEPLAAVGAVILSFLLAEISYRFLEQPVRIGSLNLRKLRLTLATCIAVPVATGISLFGAAQVGWGSPEIQAQQNAIQNPVQIVNNGCYFPDTASVGSWNESNCIFGDDSESDGEPLYLVGDSNAAQFVSGINEASKQLNRPLIIRGASGCPFMDVETVGFRDGNACFEFDLETIDYLMHATPGTVVIANADFYFRSDDQSLVSRNGPTAIPLEKQKLYLESLGRVSEQLLKHQKEVVIIGTIPNWIVAAGEHDSITYDNCSPAERTAFNCGGISEALSAKVARQGVLWAGEEEISTNTANIKYFDFSNEICPGQVCDFKKGKLWVYQDRAHITDAMSISLISRWKEILTTTSSADN